MVGNLPYNISTPILLHLLDHAAAIADQHLMLQKEVGQRIAAAAGTKDYGRLSVLMQWRCEIEAVLHVPPAAFDPPPKVHSILLRIEPRAAPAPVQRATLEALVAAGFAQRRKLLRHMLGPWLEARGYRGAFDLRRRAEEVPVAEWVGLAQSLAEEGPCAGEGPG
jgi:16S rRNA (adenine1518-N6/adenine1519-N6)-dimethyltransferase